ncbi:phage baseplate assembly protein V [Wohlfahrtiimonas larvae]|uniref:Gp5/Type VI secretion system Vgr protein OB-fold domain-containing protein n=1 Tax=Wohlfahrtiimonas larvae TaxID=1157986 RepID=A0ABP9MJ03_9GAMM|nr:phage baseplate assembly protein V [Wohlfahrtiimonas larvae]
MSDLLRKLDNLIRVGTIAEVNLSSAPAMVRVEVDEGVKSDWMPFSQAFIGQTMIWCAPKIGMSGLVVSEGGENRVNRFFPCFNDSSNAPALGEDDFKIFLKNGDSIHHNSDSGILTINSASQVIVNSKKADVNAAKITLNGDTTITKTLTVQGFASFNGGFAMNAGFARSAMYQAMSANYSLMSSNVRSNVVGMINIPIIVNATMTYNIDPVLHGVPYLEHAHTDVKAGGDNTGGVA